MIYYLKLILVLLAYTLTGAIVAVIIGYLFGAIGGLLLTFYNNLLPDAPNGAYLPMALLTGNIGAILTILPGALGGFLTGIVKIVIKRNDERKENEKIA